jgi:hypothetical protein
MGAKDAISQTFIIFAKIKGIFLRFIGCVITGFFGLCILIGFVMKPEKDVRGLIFCFFGMVIGNIVLIWGNRTLRTVKRCKRYVEIIAGQNEVDIHHIAGILSQSVDFVIHDLQKMISGRLFVGAHLDMNTQRIIFDCRPSKTTKISWRSMITNLKKYPISSVAWIPLCLFALLLFFCCVVDFSGRFIVGVFGSIGIIVSYLGTRFRSIERQWKYVQIIGRKRERDINQIAKSMRSSVDEVIIELKDMGAKGLMNIQIDEEKKEILIINPVKSSVPGAN